MLDRVSVLLSIRFVVTVRLSRFVSVLLGGSFRGRDSLIRMDYVVFGKGRWTLGSILVRNVRFRFVTSLNVAM